MALLSHEIYVPMEDKLLTVMSLPPIHRGKYLKLYCENPIQRDVYMLSNGTLTGPYRSGQRANNGITFTAQFFGSECLLLCVNKSAMAVGGKMVINPITAVLPSGIVVDIGLECQANATFHVTDTEALIEEYRNSQFTDAGALIQESLSSYLRTSLTQVLTKLTFSNPMPLVLSCLQNIAATLCESARAYLDRKIDSIYIDRVDIDLRCTNIPQIMSVINAPRPALPPEMVSIVQTILSNPALTYDQQLKLMDRLCDGSNKYDPLLMTQAAQSIAYLNAGA